MLAIGRNGRSCHTLLDASGVSVKERKKGVGLCAWGLQVERRLLKKEVFGILRNLTRDFYLSLGVAVSSECWQSS